MPWSAVPAVPPRSNPHQLAFLALLQIMLQTLLQMLWGKLWSSEKDHFQYLKQNACRKALCIIQPLRFPLNLTKIETKNSREQLRRGFRPSPKEVAMIRLFDLRLISTHFQDGVLFERGNTPPSAQMSIWNSWTKSSESLNGKIGENLSFDFSTVDKHLLGTHLIRTKSQIHPSWSWWNRAKSDSVLREEDAFTNESSTHLAALFRSVLFVLHP